MEERHSTIRSQSGFTFIEVLMSMAIFTMVTAGIFLTYGNIIEVINRTRSRTIGTSILNQEIEKIRNLEFDNIGVIGGFPPGVLPYEQMIEREGHTFRLRTFVRNIDDPFDGTTGGSPNDTAPADYRLVELELLCTSCFRPVPVTYTTWAAPENLEASSPNGSLFINVFDSHGHPVPQADVWVQNDDLDPSIVIVDVTNNSGTLQLIDIPTSTVGYEIAVTKNGYSEAITYEPGAPVNPNPIKPHSTVVKQEITEISFAIDEYATLGVRSQDHFCSAVPGIGFNQIGEILVGQDPDVYRYTDSFTTNGNGDITISDVPWDTYTITPTTTSNFLVGSNPVIPFALNAGSSTDVHFVFEPAGTRALMVTVVDESGAQLTDATVTVTKGAFNETKKTGERLFEQTDWTGIGKYFLQDGMIDVATPGQLTIKQVPGGYATSTNSWLISNTYDMGTSTTEFFNISMTPGAQPPGTTMQFQLASNNDQATWTYVGPDGTPGTYYTTPSPIGVWHDGNRYLRYKAYMNTTNAANTPTLHDVSLTFRSGCTPQAQAFWSNLANGSHDISVSKAGYVTATSSISLGTGWHERRIPLTLPDE